MDPLFSWPALAALLIGYALGSIPFGLILTRAAGLGDIRKIGSGNIGATNVLRTGNKGLAAATLLLDGLKGAVAVWLGREFGAEMGIAILASLLAGLGAFLGHLFPVWLGFKGGKGVATYIGVVASLFLPAALVFCGVWLSVAIASRFSSLSALLASIATPAYLYYADYRPEMWLAILMSALLIWKHHANIGRLLAGEEPRIGAKT